MGQPPEKRDAWACCPQEPSCCGAPPCPGGSGGGIALTGTWGHPSDTHRVHYTQAGPHLWPRGLPLPHPQSGNIGSSGHLFFYLCPPPPARPKPAMTQAGRIHASFLAEAGASAGRSQPLNSHQAPPLASHGHRVWGRLAAPTPPQIALYPWVTICFCISSLRPPRHPWWPPQGLCGAVTPAKPI